MYKEEIFGPVVVVNEFEDEEDVINRANDTEFGLSAAVYSQDINRAMRVASKINSGTVCINCATQNSIEVPFGGTKQSGWGRENGKVSLNPPLFLCICKSSYCILLSLYILHDGIYN